MKRVLYCLLLMFFIFLSLYTACADGFSEDPNRINLAAKSVMKLEVLNKNGDVIKTGSGFVAFDNRHLVTNYHVADEADMIYAYGDTGDPYIIMDVCISDSQKDIAILQFFSPTDMSPLRLNESGEITRATSIVAIGSPKGFSNSVSTGIISSAFEDEGCQLIQFTAPISSGSSGGALFNDDGIVIGITSMSYDDGQGVSQNLNFAVNIKEAIDLYEKYDGNKHKLSDIILSDVSTPDISITFSEYANPLYTGEWYLKTMQNGDETIDVAAMGLNGVMTLNDDWTCSMTGMGNDIIGTWKDENDKITITIDDNDAEVMLSNGELTVSVGDTKMVFAREAPAARPDTAEIKTDTTAKEFNGEWTCIALGVGDQRIDATTATANGQELPRMTFNNGMITLKGGPIADAFASFKERLTYTNGTYSFMIKSANVSVKANILLDDTMAVEFAADEQVTTLYFKKVK